MDRNALVSPQSRVGFAVAAAFASALVLSSVLWLFAGDRTPAATAMRSQVLVCADGRADPVRARIR